MVVVTEPVPGVTGLPVALSRMVTVCPETGAPFALMAPPAIFVLPEAAFFAMMSLRAWGWAFAKLWVLLATPLPLST